ncbi:hypothetical protein BDW02DRAFT_464442, partial [Decorospora gaudefroyi]
PRPPQSIPTIKVPRPAKPTFTTLKLSKESDLRGAIKEWICEFRDEGPYGEDVDALIKYLRKVVLEERDLGKAVGVVSWIEYVSSEKDERGIWTTPIKRVRDGVRGAARERGLGDVVFD